MIKSYERKANYGILLGIGCFAVGIAVGAASDMSTAPEVLKKVANAGSLILAVACPLPFFWGCCMYACAKGYRFWWGALALVPAVGLVALVFLPDRARSGFVQHQRGFEVTVVEPHP